MSLRILLNHTWRFTTITFRITWTNLACNRAVKQGQDHKIMNRKYDTETMQASEEHQNFLLY
jgi:hypothetical protein